MACAPGEIRAKPVGIGFAADIAEYMGRRIGKIGLIKFSSKLFSILALIDFLSPVSLPI
jgi:hypothetical protein